MSSVVTAWPPSTPEGARFERADSRARARQWDVLLVDDFPAEEDITQLKLLWCSGSAQRGGGQRARAVGAEPATIYVSLRVCIYDATGVRRIWGRDAEK